MWEFLASALSTVPAVATSKLALVAYVVAIGAYVATIWRIVRNRNLLQHLKKLPEGDRIAALELEMNGVRIAKGVSPEQWLRSRLHRYFFMAFIATCATIILVAALALSKQGDANISVDLYQHSSLKSDLPSPLFHTFFLLRAAHADGEFVDPRQLVEPRKASEPDRAFQYTYQKKGARISVRPKVPYVENSRRGDVIEGLDRSWKSLDWDFPYLSVKVSNNSSETLLLTDVIFRVAESKVDVRPIIVVGGPGYFGELWIANEGWGPVVNPSLRLEIASYETCDKPFSLLGAEPVPISTFDDTFLITLPEYIPAELSEKLLVCGAEIGEACVEGICSYSNELSEIQCLDEAVSRQECEILSRQPSAEFTRELLGYANEYLKGKTNTITYFRKCLQFPVCVSGEMTFWDVDGFRSTVKFRTGVYMGDPPIGAASPPTYTYDVFLEAGKKNYILHKSISQVIKPGEVDHFLLKLATDKSASFEFSMEILSAGEVLQWQSDFDLELFVPRSTGRFVANE